MVYRISEEPNPLLMENLKCLQDCAGGNSSFHKDLRVRRALMRRPEKNGANCLPAIVQFRGQT
jgi:hypothetical protein